MIPLGGICAKLRGAILLKGGSRLLEQGIHAHMMGYGGMMGGFGAFGLLTGLVILVDLVLFGIWLWQQISKK
jgi:uncharacterized membrane protein